MNLLLPAPPFFQTHEELFDMSSSAEISATTGHPGSLKAVKSKKESSSIANEGTRAQLEGEADDEQLVRDRNLATSLIL